MKLKRCRVTNFGSYAQFEIDFSNIGLGLIYGPTGSGKSTIPDMPAWILYGVTAKDGAVDEVRCWTNPGEPTTGELEVELPNGTIKVTRVRGKASQNDLFWTEAATSENLQRGKDLPETQRLLEARLGVPATSYLTGAYFHEFSPTGGFFTAKSKDRRAVFERVASLDLPARLADRSSLARKAARAEHDTCVGEVQRVQGRLESLEKSSAEAMRTGEQWEAKQFETIRALEAKAAGFEEEKRKTLAKLLEQAQDFESQKVTNLERIQKKADEYASELFNKVEAMLDELEGLEAAIKDPKSFDEQMTAGKAYSRCKSCGSIPEEAQKKLLELTQAKAENAARITQFEAGKRELAKLQGAENPYQAQLDQAAKTLNPYTGKFDQVKTSENPYYEQIETERQRSNPFTDTRIRLAEQIEEVRKDLGIRTAACTALEQRVAALSHLYDLSFELRGELLRKAVKQIEDSTNRFLETYFDAELRVGFSLEGADNLNVQIQKSGYDCVYRQLSKGQRQLLKLCFVVSVMKAAANSAGVHFANLFFDEALDGLDSELKVKAFSLFEELESDHETVLLIDHAPEFQNLFARKYRVSMQGDQSEMILEDSTD